MELTRQLKIANAQANPRMLEDREEQLQTALSRQQNLEVKLAAEKEASQMARDEAAEVGCNVCCLIAMYVFGRDTLPCNLTRV